MQGIGHITVFIDLPVDFLQVLIDQIDPHLIGDFSQPGVLITIDDISLGCLDIGRRQDDLFNDVLHVLYAHDLVAKELLCQVKDSYGQFFGSLNIKFACCGPCLFNGFGDFFRVKLNVPAIPLSYLAVHVPSPCFRRSIFPQDIVTKLTYNTIYWHFARKR